MKTKCNVEAARLLRKAADIVEGAREQEYGNYVDNLATMSKISDADSFTCAKVMQGVKQARLENSNFHEDSMIDMLGYTALRLAIFGK